MCKKTIYLVSFVLMLGSVSNAAEIFWSDGAADHNHLWTDPDNWLGGVVPGPGDEVQILSPEADAGHGPIIQDGMDITLAGLKNEMEGRPGKPELTMTGGNLEITDFVWWGDYDDIEAFWYHSGGTVTVAGELELGWGPNTGGAGTLDMTGGTISAGKLVIPTGSGAYGELYLRGGTFEVRNSGGFKMNANGLVDVSGGTLVLEGDDTAKINNLIAAGQITAYGGRGNFELDYDDRNPGKTTLTAAWEGWPIAGAWISIVPIPDLGDIIGEFTVSPQDLDGVNFTCMTRPAKPEPTVFGVFPDADHQSDHIGQLIKTGLNTYESTVIGYGTKKAELPGMLPEIVYISVLYAKTQLIDENTAKGEGTHAFFLGSQDADGDGLPDEGQEPVACFPYISTAKRVQLLPPCVPPPPEPEGE